MFLYAPFLFHQIPSLIHTRQAEEQQVQWSFLRVLRVQDPTAANGRQHFLRAMLFDVFHKYSLSQSSQQPYEGEETEIQAQAQVHVK